MVAISTEHAGRPVFYPEILSPQRRPVPFVREILQIGMNEQINIPTVDACYLAQEHRATVNYLLAQTVRQNSLDTTGIIAPLIGYAHDPSEAAFYAASSAQFALDALSATKGEGAKKKMFAVLFEQAPPTIEDLLNLDITWGKTVNGLKFAPTQQATNFRERNLMTLMRLAEQRTGGKIARLTQREFESGGSSGGHLSDVTEALLLPKIDMPELDVIVPTMLRHGYAEPKETQTDIVRFLRRGGILGNDLTRSIMDAIKSLLDEAPLHQYVESNP